MHDSEPRYKTYSLASRRVKKRSSACASASAIEGPTRSRRREKSSASRANGFGKSKRSPSRSCGAIQSCVASRPNGRCLTDRPIPTACRFIPDLQDCRGRQVRCPQAGNALPASPHNPFPSFAASVFLTGGIRLRLGQEHFHISRIQKVGLTVAIREFIRSSRAGSLRPTKRSNPSFFRRSTPARPSTRHSHAV
jgi:hypothetical protein